MQGISSRWLTRMLPWVNVPGATYRVNRRLSYTLGDGRVSFVKTGAKVQVVPAELGELPPLRGFTDDDALGALAEKFVQKEYEPTPDDLDELLSMRRKTRCFLAHPKAIAAFGRECNKRAIYFGGVELHGNHLPAWRGVPLLPCGKIPISKQGTSSIIAMRTGEDDQGVIGLYQTGIPDEVEPGLNVRFMGIDEKAIISYLVSNYYSAAVLVPDALGVLENVQVTRTNGN
jgi:hypothetical protein